MGSPGNGWPRSGDVTVRISRLHFPVTVLGPGTRVGIWMQGCGIGCSGCMARDTWASSGGTGMPVTELLSICQAWFDRGATGVTISGGDPFDQPEPLAAILVGLRNIVRSAAAEIDVLCYSGRGLSWLQRRHPEILSLIDALVPEPYRPEAGAGGPWRGSGNQPLILLSELAQRRYTPEVLADGARRLQLAVDDDGIWMIGVPGPGDMDRLTSTLESRGLILGGESWRP